MKLIIVINDDTNTVELAIPSRELSAEETLSLYEIVRHGKGRTAHFTDCTDRAMPYTDIAEFCRQYVKSIGTSPH